MIDYPADPGCDSSFDFDEFNLPILSEPEPVIILHGISGSINPDIFISGILNDNWYLLGNTYKPLIQAFEDAGFKQGKDLFVGFYDWRQSNTDSVNDYLIPLIDEAKQESGNSQVDIVAHSMGGILARSYIQSNDYLTRNDVDQLIILGTPNKGSSDVYNLWEGGDIPNNWNKWIASLMSSYISFLQTKQGYTSFYQAIHNFIPSVGELMPTYDFLADKDNNNVIKPNSSMIEQNPFLEGLNSSVNDLISRVEVFMIVGDSQPTVNTIPVVERESDDAPLWIDGKPDPINPELNDNEGDNRVLLSSAKLSEITDVITMNSSHGDLPSLATQDIFSKLGLSDPGPIAALPKPETVLGFWFASPVKPKITDPDGNFIEPDKITIPNAEYISETNPNGFKLILIPDPVDGFYEIELEGTGNGEYHLGTTFVSSSGEFSEVKQGEVENGEIIKYQVELNTENNQNPTQTEAVTLDTLKNNLEKFWQEKLITKFSTYLKLKAKLTGIESIFKTKAELEAKTENAPWYLKRALKQGLKGLDNVLKKQYEQFIKEIEKEKGKSIDEQTADWLIEQARYLKNQL